MERLDKIVASAGLLSRALARGAILTGKVSVNGQVVKDIGLKIDPKNANIEIKGESLTFKKHVYIVMNKPKGVISAGNDKNAKTVIDILPQNLKRNGLFPVGRLDKDTTGMLIITDDGDFSHRLLSPSKKVPKTYFAVLDAPVNEEVIMGFEKGVTLVDGTKLMSAELRCGEKQCTAYITIKEGKYHQIKRMFGVFNIGVNELHRTSFGGLELPHDLKIGESRELTENELMTLNRTIN